MIINCSNTKTTAKTTAGTTFWNDAYKILKTYCNEKNLYIRNGAVSPVLSIMPERKRDI